LDDPLPPKSDHTFEWKDGVHQGKIQRGGIKENKRGKEWRGDNTLIVG
jgi:hypothetical protein